ncbi:uncharacterized protein LOC108863799 [Galendromus occidentalis]|uniref:Uncharacterized protein LOC108863799 n=1 Tax=Galendromus occidentalis TaxID=34638 RepID=A0AAJ7P930_9ACAR|nr:uncharacterized protein LOC108863799 [Galendromus occidentalis]
MTSFSEHQLDQLRKLLETEFDKRWGKFIEHVDGRMKTVETEISKIQMENKSLKTRINTLESLAMRNRIEIQGFPQESKLDGREITKRLAKQAKLELGDDQILFAMRTGPVRTIKGVSSQTINVEFSTIALCDQFMSGIKTLRESRPAKQLDSKLISTRANPQPIYVSRKYSNEVKRLRSLAMLKKKSLKYDYCWISDSGKLCMRKSTGSPVIFISSEEDILQLK